MAGEEGEGVATATAVPKATIYVHNLDEKTPKSTLKKSLYSVFSQFGKIEGVIARRGFKLRGQAWVIFENEAAATAALRRMQGFPFLGNKPLKIEFSHTDSEQHAMKKGTWVPKDKRAAQKKVAVPREQPQQQAQEMEVDVGDPNSILFAEELPGDCTQQALTLLFQQYAGFKEVRMIPGSEGTMRAFIEFGDAMQAGLALQTLRGFKLTPTTSLKLTYAKK